jgi:hypothetical protein
LIGHSEIVYCFKEKFVFCSLLESQSGGKKGIEKNRDENPIIYLIVVLEAKKNSSDVYKGDIMKVV